MPQTVYNLDNVVATPGQVVNQEAADIVGKYQASEALPPGRLVELNPADGKVRLYRGGQKIGVSMYKDARDPQYDETDEFVRILREGQIYVEFSGSAAVDRADANVKGSSTTATDRGKFTDSVPDATTGAEIFDGGRAKFASVDSTGTALPDASALTVALLEVDYTAENEIPGVPNDAPALAYVSNDAAPATLQNGATYDVPTTGAASTITLPAAAPDKTRVFFTADGTKNGHTLTYRDATGPTNLTTALVASKRHFVECVKLGGKWFANAYTSP